MNTMTVKERFTYLQQRYLNQQETEAERTELQVLLTTHPEQEDLETALLAIGEQEPVNELYEPQRWETLLKSILKEPVKMTVTAHRIQFFKTRWFRYAAVLLLIAGTTTFLYLNYLPRPVIALENTSTQQRIVPGSNKAILTLGDGHRIVLDSATVGYLATQGNTKIQKSNEGALTYQSGATNGEIAYNTISTPNGGQYQVTLPDGTRVWLNAASSVRFPTAFGKERMVEITGELYLEVAPGKNSPFYVKTNGTTIQVLGTSFNVNAYSDEAADKISLLEGSVKIGSTILKPGQAYSLGNILTTDLTQDVAWKNGVFNFTNKPFKASMRELARWYDIVITYEQPVQKIQFGGSLKRNLSWSEMLDFLGGVGLRYRLEGPNKLVVLNN